MEGRLVSRVHDQAFREGLLLSEFCENYKDRRNLTIEILYKKTLLTQGFLKV